MPVHHFSARGGRPPGRHPARLYHQGIANPLPDAIIPPSVEIALTVGTGGNARGNRF